MLESVCVKVRLHGEEASRWSAMRHQESPHSKMAYLVFSCCPKIESDVEKPRGIGTGSCSAMKRKRSTRRQKVVCRLPMN